jgi:hypothetical protein
MINNTHPNGAITNKNKMGAITLNKCLNILRIRAITGTLLIKHPDGYVLT